MCGDELNWDDICRETLVEYALICDAVDRSEAEREGLTLGEFRSRVTPGAQEAWQGLCNELHEQASR